MPLQEKHKVKRGIMLVSYTAIIVTLFLILLTVFYGNDSTADNITAAQGIIISIIAFLTGLVISILGITHQDNMKNGHDT